MNIPSKTRKWFRMCRMRILRPRITPIIVYLVFLFFYGFTMMMASLRRQSAYGEDSAEFYVERSETLLEEDVKDALSYRMSGRKREHQPDSEIVSAKDFFSRLEKPEAYCRKLVDIGGTSCRKRFDNNKYLCLDDDVFLNPRNCTVFSFGVGDDISFDNQMRKYGCHVYMFDPTISSDLISKAIQKRKKLHFHKIGISSGNQEFKYRWEDEKDQSTGVVDTLANIKKKIKMENIPVDYLKMDIESSEWKALPNMVVENGFEHVKQFALEIHVNVIKQLAEEEKVIIILQKMWNVLNRVKQLGFKRISYRPNKIESCSYSVPGEKDPIFTCGEAFYIRRTLK